MNKPANEYIMAIKPEWVALIESKEKTLEIRRTAPHISPPVSDRCLCPPWAAISRRKAGASERRKKHERKTALFLRHDPPGTRHE